MKSIKLIFLNRIEISQATLSELEQDKYKPSVETILSIVSEFVVDLEWFLVGEKGSEDKAFGLNILSRVQYFISVLYCSIFILGVLL
ncbi:XRE family transcriptional regulator [Brevibacillus laterosporus]|uniref:XRE family transcriptional regulator n=1 Tax=Brevibacillus laterosporus TaxID=1465 RepID=A0A518VFH9_BRELA|nr:XRE family transcriptional regulator [Brevibacillus laterosporus]